MSTHGNKLFYVLALGALMAGPAIGEESLQSEVVFEPEYARGAARVEEGAYVDASGSEEEALELDLTIDVMRSLTPEQIREALGGMVDTGMTGAVTPAENQLELIEVRATREQYEPVETAIPFGFASIAWAFRNPTESWRIFFPVMTS